MLFLKNLLLRNFQGCCLLFNYQGSSLFLLIRSSFDILSRRFPFVKNFFHFLFTVCSGSVSPSQVSFNRLSHPHPSVKNFFHVVQRSALASCPTVALGLILFIGLSQRQVVSYHGKSELSMFFLFFIFTLLRNMLNIISFSKKNYNFKLERRKETVKDTVSEVL